MKSRSFAIHRSFGLPLAQWKFLRASVSVLNLLWLGGILYPNSSISLGRSGLSLLQGRLAFPLEPCLGVR